MKQEVLIALISSLVEDAIEQNPIKKGPRGSKGSKGRDFSFEEHSESIQNQINKYIESIQDSLKIKFNDLTHEDKKSLKGKDGKSFSFAKYQDQIQDQVQGYISSIQESLKLKFSDLSDEEKILLKGEKGRRGKSFSFEAEKENLISLVKDHSDELRLKFKDLSEEEKESIKLKLSDLTEEELESLKIRGSRGQRGKSIKGDPGESFNFEDEKKNISNILESLLSEIRSDISLKFTDLAEDERDSLKLKFTDLTDDEKFSLRGGRGQKGKQGRSFDFDSEKEKISDLVLENKEDLRLKYVDLSKDEINSLIGPRGPIGISGRNGISIPGSDGLDGVDAPRVIDIEIEQITKTKIRFIFIFDDGSRIESDTVELPKQVSVSNNYISSASVASSDTAERLIIRRILDEDAPAKRLVSATSDTNIALGQFDDIEKSVIIGLTTEAGLAGEEVPVLLFGADSDAGYTFALNTRIYLTTDGQMSNTPPAVGGYRCLVAKSLGVGAIFISIEEPLEN